MSLRKLRGHGRLDRVDTDFPPNVSKMVDLGSGSQRQIEDIMLTRYAC